MKVMTRRTVGRASIVLFSTISIAAISGCGTKTEVAESGGKTRSSEYFAESVYGVKASPRVSSLASGLPRGGGRDQIGKPYQIRGKWYHPRKQPDYRSTGLASWYGDAFHGRLTANGEVYDMTHLTAAHPTMPLPSYARVTNKRDGTSVIVRVNDRGPFHDNRVIDLSRRAAELLDFTHQGVAQVQVEYLGRAPLHGQDEEFLLASYRPAGDPASDGLPTGVMMAMAGDTPTQSSAGQGAEQALRSQASSQPVTPAAGGASPVDLPDAGPVLTRRPASTLATAKPAMPTGVLAYAATDMSQATQALSSLAQGRLAVASQQVVAQGDYVAVGTFDDASEARHFAAWLQDYGDASFETAGEGIALALHPRDGYGVDDILRQAWRLGAEDAMTVRQ